MLYKTAELEGDLLDSAVEVAQRWKDNGLSVPPACEHKKTRSVNEGEIILRCYSCGAGKNLMADWCLP